MSTNESTKIGVGTATITGMNAMIGSGIFTAPAALATDVGPAAILTYIFVVISVWFMAQSISRLAALFPEEGSFYTYAKQWGGHTVGVIAGSFYFIGLLIAMGLLAQIAGHYLHDLFLPQFSPDTLGKITLFLLVVLNMFGVTLSELGQRILIALTLFPLITTTIMCFAKGNWSNLTPFVPFGFGNVFSATRVVIFNFFGFECAASLFSVVKNPQKNVPKALTYSIILVGIIYIMFISSIILSVPLSEFVNPHIPITRVLAPLFPNNTWVLTLVGVSIISAIVGTVHSMIWSSSTLLVSLTKKIIHPQKFMLTQPISVFLVGCSIFLSFVLLKDINLFFNFTAVFIVSAYILSMISLLFIPTEWKSKQNIITLFGIATGCAMLYFALEGLAHHFFA